MNEIVMEFMSHFGDVTLKNLSPAIRQATVCVCVEMCVFVGIIFGSLSKTVPTECNS